MSARQPPRLPLSEPVRPPDASTPAAQAFLDAALDRVLRAWAEGQALRLDDLTAERPELRTELAALVDMARETAFLRPQMLPEVPGYDVLHEIGRGGMGIVYAARQRGLDRVVALKVLPHISSDSDAARARFLAEARSLARVQHPHVVAIFDVIELTDTCAYAMEWIDGKSLADVLHELRTWPRQGDAPAVRFGGEGSATLPRDPVVWCCRVGIAVARALSAMHQRGLVHRDVKPGNILLRGDGTPLLSDFGLVRDEGAQFTRTGQVVGTVAFAPPEQLAGELLRVGPRSDVFALGATLHWALAGAPPYLGETAAELQANIAARARQSLTALRLPRDLDTIVGKCLEPRSEDRYASADAVADDLESLLALRPIRARPLGVAARAVRLVRRNRRIVAVAVVSAVVMLVVSALFGWRLWQRAQVPAEFEAHIHEARRALLDPSYVERGVRATRDESLPAKNTLERVGVALEEYDAALALDPTRHDIAREREVVALAQVDLQAIDVLQRRVNTLAMPRCQALPPHLAAEARLRGLHAFVVGDVPACNAAWAEFDLAPTADPLVDAAMGQVHFASDRPALAYPRLLRAFDAWSTEGYLAVAVTRCATQLGDLSVADRFLTTAIHLGASDAARRLAHAELSAARGLVATARNGYDLINWDYAAAGEWPALRRCAQLMQLTGSPERAVDLLSGLAERNPSDSTCLTLLEGAAVSWWSSLSISRQAQEVVHCWNTTESWPRLHRVSTALATLGRESAKFATVASAGSSQGAYRQHGFLSILPMETTMKAPFRFGLVQRVPFVIQHAVAQAALFVQDSHGRGISQSGPQAWARRHAAQQILTTLGFVLSMLSGHASGQLTVESRSPSPAPIGRLLAASAFSPSSGEVIMHGGASDVSGILGDTWRWSCMTGRWLSVSTPNPGTRAEAVMAPETGGTLVLFGGRNASGSMSDTWRWGGSMWTQLAPAVSPPARHNHAMAFDSARGVIVMFGGEGAGNQTLGDTWEWNGATWRSVITTTAPRPVFGHAMTYDPIRRRVVLVGGGSRPHPITLSNETWEWDGVIWTLRGTSTTPSPRYWHGLAWDAARNRAVLFGGESASTPFLNDIWEWDGTTWQQRSLLAASTPAPRRAGVFQYDATTREILCFSGRTSGTTQPPDTWIIRPLAHAAFTPTGAGCAGTNGTPTLAAAPASLPWIGHTFTAQITSVPDFFPVPIFLLGFSNPTAPGLLCRNDCTLRALPDLAFALAPRNGEATWSIPIPDNRDLLGASNLFTQVVVFNFATGCVDAMSNSMRMTIGSR